MYHDPIYSFPAPLGPPKTSHLNFHVCAYPTEPACTCETIHGNMGNLPEVMSPSKKKTPLLLAAITGQELLSEGWSLMRPRVSQAEMLTGLILCGQTQLS